ncbi:MAG: hypothetical protein M4579_001955 [Chaenotheca gracillima]|nr:MAG: hypothetical protein M4579_001955 [Chaenotheca gracillima]
MNPPNRQRPLARSPLPHAQSQPQPPTQQQRPASDSSDSSNSSQVTTLSLQKRSPYAQDVSERSSSRANLGQGGTPVPPNSTTNFSRPSIAIAFDNDSSSRSKSPTSPTGQGSQSRHGRQHSQGFFEPSLPSASSGNLQNMSNLTASQIAAQAAMQHQSSQQHMRKRSQTVPSPQAPPEAPTGRRKPNSPPALHINNGSANQASFGAGPAMQYQNGLLGSHASAAATAASAAYPRSAMSSPGLPQQEMPPPLPEKDPKQKSEKSKIKLFSKPKNIGVSREKDGDRKDRGLPSPNKMGSYAPSPFPRLMNASTTSLADSMNSGSPTFYQTANSSSATLVPINDKGTSSEKQHKHHFLSRQKHKLKEKDDHHALQLSSASSNSRPRDPNMPQSLYSFAPSSPSAASTTFSKSKSGLDLRHGGRALREKKKEEKASAAAIAPVVPTPDSSYRDADSPATGGSEWFAGIHHGYGPYPGGPPTTGSLTSANDGGAFMETPGKIGLQGFGLVGMTPDDAWPFLKAKLLVVFEGASIRFPIEDLNRLVVAHIQRCVQKRAPSTLTEDLRDLLQTGFRSLNQTLNFIPEEALIPKLVEMWLEVFGTILPYIQAVFLPLDLEFKGTGTIMTHREAQEFWGALPNGEMDSPLGESLDVRRIVLIAFRDNVILPRHDALKAIFSRLSLENINGVPLPPSLPPKSSSSDGASGGRPGTAMSLDPALASFNSQGSTLLNDSSAASISGGGARSRATSNTSSAFGSSAAAPDVLSSTPPIQGQTQRPGGPNQYHRPSSSSNGPINKFNQGYPLPASTSTRQTSPSDSNRLTERVGRMLQCVSVLASVQQTGPVENGLDEPQRQMEELAKTLKLNWLGRGRTGRNRRGFVGTRQPLRLPPPPREDEQGPELPLRDRAGSGPVSGEAQRRAEFSSRRESML